MIIFDQIKWDVTQKKVEAFKVQHGIGPDGDHFATEHLASDYGRLLEQLYDGYYKFNEVDKDQYGFHPNTPKQSLSLNFLNRD